MGLISILFENPVIFILIVTALMFALCVHEFSHGYIAYIHGDDTAYRMGRLTLNPLSHLDPIGSLMILFLGIGYAKPVPVNPNNLKILSVTKEVKQIIHRIKRLKSTPFFNDLSDIKKFLLNNKCEIQLFYSASH